jgi:soluble lytic murein transglycosylase-like protein
VTALLRQAAARYNLPESLLLAIAWQESGWEQHVISRDGGIGVMQIMPYTAMSLNAATGIQRDPYKLNDNIYLGAHYLHTLWINFHGDQTKVISAYNEGGWAVVHRGIFNWRYVNNVRYLMRVLR